MLIIKTRKQGNSLVITLPAASDHLLKSNQEFYVCYGEDGSVVLTPKIENPFEVAETGSMYETEIWNKMPRVGEEIE